MSDTQVDPTTVDDAVFRDFDEAVEGARKISFKAGGRTYEIPAEPPAKKMLLWIKQGRIKDGNLADLGDFDELFELFLGKEIVDQMLEDGVGLVTFGEIARWLTEVYRLGAPMTANGDGGEDETPPSASSTSSRSGRTSRRTSSGSTKGRR